MNKRLLFLVSILAIAFAATTSLTGCGKGCMGKQVSLVPTGAFELIPIDSNAVVGVNWKKILGSPLGAKMQQGVPPEVAPVVQDVDSVVVGLNLQSAKSDPDFVAVVSGKLDAAKLTALMTQQASKEGSTITDEVYEGVTIKSSSKTPQIGVAFVQDKALVGTKVSVKKAIDLSKKKGDAIDKNKPLMDLVNTVDKGKMLWAAAVIPPGMIPAGGPGGMGGPMAALGSLKAIDLAIDYLDSLTLDLGVVAASADDAKQIQTMANSYKTLFGGAMAAKDPSIGKVLNALTIDAKNDRVVLALKLDKATVDDLANKAGQAVPPMAPGQPAPMGMPMDPGTAPSAPMMPPAPAPMAAQPPVPMAPAPAAPPSVPMAAPPPAPVVPPPPPAPAPPAAPY